MTHDMVITVAAFIPFADGPNALLSLKQASHGLCL